MPIKYKLNYDRNSYNNFRSIKFKFKINFIFYYKIKNLSQNIFKNIFYELKKVIYTSIWKNWHTKLIIILIL